MGVETMGGSAVSGFSRRTFVATLGLGIGAVALRVLAGNLVPRRPNASGAPVPRRAASLSATMTESGLELRPLPLEDDGPIYRLNETAAHIWDRADGRHTILEISQSVAEQFGAPPARALRDTVAFLQSLSSAGLTFAFSDQPSGA